MVRKSAVQRATEPRLSNGLVRFFRCLKSARRLSGNPRKTLNSGMLERDCLLPKFDVKGRAPHYAPRPRARTG